jgi:hypothetical protein
VLAQNKIHIVRTCRSGGAEEDWAFTSIGKRINIGQGTTILRKKEVSIRESS